MLIITFMSFMILSIIFFLILLLNFLAKKNYLDREKSSPYECGFDPKNNARLPFSLQFFLIALIFIIFDVELALLLPLIKIIKSNNIIMLFSMISSFIFILLLGLFHELNQGSLNWKI